MTLINGTPHALHILVGDVTLTLPPSGAVARADATRRPAGTLDVDGHAVPVSRLAYGALTGLPNPQADTLYVVSALAAQAAAAAGRYDVVVVDDAVRDDAGRIIGCRGLAVI